MLQGDAAWLEQITTNQQHVVGLVLTVWRQDCLVTVHDVRRLPLAQLAKMYTVPLLLSMALYYFCSFKDIMPCITEHYGPTSDNCICTVFCRVSCSRLSSSTELSAHHAHRTALQHISCNLSSTIDLLFCNGSYCTCGHYCTTTNGCV